jgi:predicted permease
MIARLLSLLSVLRHRMRFEEQMQEELRFHIDAYAKDLERAGLTHAEAMRRARMEFGTVDGVKADCRRARGLQLLEEVAQDIRYAGRLMAKAPGFTTAAVLSLALGIGASTAIFTLIDAVLLRQVAAQRPDELYYLAHGRGTSVGSMSNYPLFEQYVSAPVFTGVAAYDGPVPLKVSDPTGVSFVTGQHVTRTYHAVIGVPFVLGRGFVPGPDRSGDDAFSAVISYAYWQQRFGGRGDVLGQTLVVNRRVVSIVGVTTPEFTGFTPGTPVDITLPLAFKVLDSAGFFDRHDTWTSMPIIARVKSGIRDEEVQRATDLLFQQYMAEPENSWIRTSAPEAYSVATLLPADKGATPLRRQYSQALWLLMGMVSLVLLIACANIANLLLARSAGRAREIAVRLCVGGGRARIVRQFLTESSMLALAGGALGMLFAMWGTSALVALLGSGENPIVLSVSPNVRILGFTFVVSVLAGLLFGMIPTLKATAIELTPALKENASQGFTVGRWRLGKVLVTVQVALCTVLVTSAALLVQTLYNLRFQPMGFERDGVLMFALDNVADGLDKRDVARLAAEVTIRLEAVPGVIAAAASTSIPVHTSGNARVFRVPGQPAAQEQPYAWSNVITPSYFGTLGIPLVRGRLFTSQDTAAAPRVGIISETFAREHFGGADPIGRQIGLGAEPKQLTTVVGIVRDAHQASLRDAPMAMIYTPIGQSDEPPARFTVSVRTMQRPASSASTIRETVQSLDEDLVIRYMRTMEEQIDSSLARERALAMLSTAFGLLALLIAVVGLYGLVAYEVTQRVREIGIRLALGASRATVLGHVLRQILMLVIFGIALGLAGAFGATRALSTMLFRLSEHDVRTFSAVAVVLFVITLVAAFVPSRRAARLDPARAIRWE